MSWVTIIWSALCGACLMLALMHLLVWCRSRRSWSNFCFSVVVLGVIGLAVAEMTTMHAESPEFYGRAVRWAHFANLFIVAGSLGFLHFYFGTARRWLLALALGLRLLAVVANFTTGASLHIRDIGTLQKVTFLGEQVSILGDWAPNPWVRLGQFASLVWLVFVVDCSIRLWRKAPHESRRRAGIVGGGLVFFIVVNVTQAGLVAAGVLRMPFLVSFPFLGMVLAMGHELSRDVRRAARLSLDLQTSEQRLKQAVSAASLALWEWDRRTDRIWVSDEGRILYGIQPHEEIDFKRFASALHPDDRQIVSRAMEEVMAGPEPFAVEYRVVLPDGATRWIAAGGRVERDAQGRAALLRGVSMDITERKLAEQDTARHQRELAHLSRVSILGELAGAIAHELNQPLAAMLSNSQVGRRNLDAGQPDLTEMAAIFDDIAADAKRAGGIIHGMRAMFKKDVNVEAQPVDLNDAVNQAVSLLHSEVVGRKVRVDLHLDEALPPVNAGRVEVQQVLINLVLNSLDALKAGNGNTCIEIATVRQGNHVIVSVRDHGPGIPVEMMERLFEPFATTKPGGLGLGLAISRSIAERFGGELRAENHPEGGAVFRLVLPAVDALDGPLRALLRVED